MGWPAPGRLFHAIVLAGAAMGAGSCRRAALVDNAKDGAAPISDARATDGGGAADQRADTGSDVPGFDLDFDRAIGIGPEGDAGADGPRDAACDLDCGPNAGVTASCQCAIVIA